MMKLETNEKHEQFDGDPADIVNIMNAESFVAEATKAQYMRAVAKRVFILTRVLIAVDDPRTFLYGLQRAGLVTITFDSYEAAAMVC